MRGAEPPSRARPYFDRRSILTTSNGRVADHPIDPQFLDRWSSRAFDGEPLSEAELFTVIEAARWAPSAFNLQPWRFVYGLKGSAGFGALLELLAPFNRGWAEGAGALVFVLSQEYAPAKPGGAPTPLYSHSFDAGAAWGYLAIQAHLMDLVAHCMTGFDTERAPAALGASEGFRVEAAVAIGRRGDASALPEALQARETPGGRRPLGEILRQWKAPRSDGPEPE